MSQKQLGEEEKIFVVSVDPTLRYSLDLYVADDAEIAQECATEDAMEYIDLNVEVIELTLEDMQGEEDSKPFGEDGPTVKQLLEWKRQDEGWIPPKKDVPGQLFFWKDVDNKESLLPFSSSP